MSRSSSPRTGADAFLYLVGLSAVLAIVTTHWQVFLAIAVALAIAWVFTRPKPYDINSPAAKERRLRTIQARDALAHSHGWQFLSWMARAADIIAKRGSITLASLEQEMPAPAAANILAELEQLGIVALRRTTEYAPLVRPVEVREIAAILRATP